MFEPGDAELARAAGARIGMLLSDRWTLEAVLGIGGMASVYRATHRNGSKVAIKVLHSHLASHADTVRRFSREGYLANRVEHPGAVHVLDDDLASDGAPFLVMELLDGMSLDARLDAEGPLEVKPAVDVTMKVLEVVAAAHERGIVHRDLKPGNVFLLRSGEVKVLDFGIARLRELAAPGVSTLGGAVLGTPAFMPPEQARGHWVEVDARSDIWALGATLYMLLTNRSVRDEAETTNEALLYAMSKPVSPMRELCPAVPHPVGVVLDRALAFEKEARWPSAIAMRDALARALIEIGAPQWDTVLSLPPARGLDTTGGATSFAGAALSKTARSATELGMTTPASLPLFEGPIVRAPGGGAPAAAAPPVDVARSESARPPTPRASAPPASRAAVFAGIAIVVTVLALATFAILLAFGKDDDEPGSARARRSAAASDAPPPSTPIAAPALPLAPSESPLAPRTADPPRPSAKPGATRSPLDRGRF